MRSPISVVLCNEQKWGEGYMQLETFEKIKHEHP